MYEHWRYRMTALPSNISIFYVRAECKIMIGELWLQILITVLLNKPSVCAYMHNFTTTGYIWKFSISNDCSTINTFLVQFGVAREIQLGNYSARQTSVILWYKLACVHCKPIHTSLFVELLRQPLMITNCLMIVKDVSISCLGCTATNLGNNHSGVQWRGDWHKAFLATVENISLLWLTSTRGPSFLGSLPVATLHGKRKS